MFGRRSRRKEIDEEIEHHLAMLAKERKDEGASDAEARRFAHQRLGNPASVREAAGAVWSFRFLERLGQDLRYGFRALRKSPAFTIAAVLTLGLGIGANTAIFSVVNRLIVHPLPYPAAERLMMLDNRWLPRFAHFEATPADFLDWRRYNTSFEQMGAFVDEGFNLSAPDHPERIPGARITADVLPVLGVTPILGRSFTANDDQYGRAKVALLGYDVWQREFIGSREAIGTPIRLNSELYTVIGVMPRGFHFPENAELWTPMAFSPQELGSGGHFVWGVGRLKPGDTQQRAQAEMDRAYSGSDSPWRVSVFPLAEHYVGSGMRTALFVLMAAVGFVLLIACANVASLLLARGSARNKELALRASLGASSKRIGQQLLTESILLATIGGLLAIVVARGAIYFVARLSPASLSYLPEAHLNAEAFGFNTLLSLLTGAAFGLLPAWRLSRPDLQDALKSGGRSGTSELRRRMRGGLVIAEVSLAVMLLTGAGLLLKSFQQLVDIHPGFDARGLLTMQIALPETRYPSAAAQRQFVDRLVERAQNLPGAVLAAATTSIPLDSVADDGIRIDGRPLNNPLSGVAANYYAVTSSYFQTMRIALLCGRFFLPSDTSSSRPVAIINEYMARRFFPNENPIGKRIDIAGPTYLREIVGVVSDVKQTGLDTADTPQVYEPFLQKPQNSFHLVLRTAVDPASLSGPAQQQVFALDKEQPVSNVRTMNEVADTALAQRRFSALLLGVFAALALALSSVGLYGLMAYSVARRTQEIGIRMALGARQSAVLAMVLKESLRVIVAGLLVGLAGAALLGRFVASLLYNVTPTDPATFAIVAGLLISVALIATATPALRAARVDPMTALRQE